MDSGGRPPGRVIFDPYLDPPLEGPFELTGGSCGVLAQKGSKRGPNMGQNGPGTGLGPLPGGGSNMTPPWVQIWPKGPFGPGGAWNSQYSRPKWDPFWALLAIWPKGPKRPKRVIFDPLLVTFEPYGPIWPGGAWNSQYSRPKYDPSRGV
jgi:hypothetical protein